MKLLIGFACGRSATLGNITFICLDHFFDSLACSDTVDSSSILENSLNAKEKIISELNMELHNVEITLSNEREQHINEMKKLKSLLNEKVSDETLSLFRHRSYFQYFLEF